MCGRYTLTVSMEELMLRYELELALNFHPRYNIAPAQNVLAVIHDGSSLRAGQLKWGLVPSWTKDSSMGSKMINARSETLADKPAYKLPFARKRCLIPADGFYEWMKTDSGKVPYRITLRGGGIFSMAGLYDTWLQEDGSKLSTCTVITSGPNALMAPIHDRMPVILRPEDEMAWLDRGQTDVNALQKLLVPYPAEEMEAYPVSRTVNSVKNDTPDCIERVPEGA
ncbi:SOS response-associated peptidase [Paenibacillus sp. Y412MC10]|uniref:SOS response-associated peptidase n=1 Tax=Geobacillus sp. (strain Y412MC10) TaxID=481743 RepID=UPI0011AB8226|nr:SOS response-associated peptidase [Paenibacillus sp. Y412MC10]